MDILIQDAIRLLKEEAQITPSVLATAEEAVYFHSISSRIELSASLQREPIKVQAPPPITAIKPKAAPPTLPITMPPAEKVDPLPAPKPQIEKKNFAELRSWVQKILPELSLRETIPSDALAKRMSCLWEKTYLSAHVVIIAFGEVGIGMEFLKQVTSAIDKLLVPAQLIEGTNLEKERGWDLLLSSPSLKTVICSPWASWKTTSLAKYYRQNGSTGEQFLGSYKLLLLEPSLIYLKHPDRKRELWKMLSTHLSS